MGALGDDGLPPDLLAAAAEVVAIVDFYARLQHLHHMVEDRVWAGGGDDRVHLLVLKKHPATLAACHCMLATACLPESRQSVGATHWKTSSIFVPENFHND